MSSLPFTHSRTTSGSTLPGVSLSGPAMIAPGRSVMTGIRPTASWLTLAEPRSAATSPLRSTSVSVARPCVTLPTLQLPWSSATVENVASAAVVTQPAACPVRPPSAGSLIGASKSANGGTLGAEGDADRRRRQVQRPGQLFAQPPPVRHFRHVALLGQSAPRPAGLALQRFLHFLDLIDQLHLSSNNWWEAAPYKRAYSANSTEPAVRPGFRQGLPVGAASPQLRHLRFVTTPPRAFFDFELAPVRGDLARGASIAGSKTLTNTRKSMSEPKATKPANTGFTLRRVDAL